MTEHHFNYLSARVAMPAKERARALLCIIEWVFVFSLKYDAGPKLINRINRIWPGAPVKLVCRTPRSSRNLGAVLDGSQVGMGR